MNDDGGGGSNNDNDSVDDEKFCETTNTHTHFSLVA